MVVLDSPYTSGSIETVVYHLMQKQYDIYPVKGNGARDYLLLLGCSVGPTMMNLPDHLDVVPTSGETSAVMHAHERVFTLQHYPTNRWRIVVPPKYRVAFPELKKNYIDTGKVRFYSMDFPLDMHDNALQAAQAGRCAADQQKFWPMHARMHTNPNALNVNNLVEYAAQSGLDVPAFRKCLEEEKYKQDVQSAVQEASLKAVSGTPTFVIGKSTATGVEGTLLIGAQPYETFDRMLKELLR